MKLIRYLVATLCLALVAGCATQGLVPASNPRSQILEAYNLIEAAAKTRDDLAIAGMISADQWREITTDLRRYLTAVTEYDDIVRGGIPTLDRERAFTLARQGLLRLRAELLARQPKPPAAPQALPATATGARS
jgi:hypothetical protein